MKQLTINVCLVKKDFWFFFRHIITHLNILMTCDVHAYLNMHASLGTRLACKFLSIFGVCFYGGIRAGKASHGRRFLSFETTTKYSWFVDGDDYFYAPDESLFKICEDADVIRIAVGWVQTDNKTLVREVLTEGDTELSKEFLGDVLWNKIVKSSLIRDCYKKFDDVDLVYGEDSYVNEYLLSLNLKCCISNQFLYWYNTPICSIWKELKSDKDVEEYCLHHLSNLGNLASLPHHTIDTAAETLFCCVLAKHDEDSDRVKRSIVASIYCYVPVAIIHRAYEIYEALRGQYHPAENTWQELA